MSINQDILQVALVQTDLVWENKAANLANLSQKLEKAIKGIDLFVLPEMFSTGFSMQPRKLAETMDGDSVQWLLDTAKKFDTAIIGSLIIEEQGKFYNRLLFAQADGSLAHYDKRHLFTMAGEEQHYTAGQKRELFIYKGWRIAPFICYDLRFPTWCRNTADYDYDVAIFVANWPHRRSAHWRALLPARSIENQCFTLAVNRVGYDGNDIYHSGYSTALDAEGQALAELIGEEKISYCNLSKTNLRDTRARLPFLQDRD
jgi:predicted amidohydrolase